MNDIKKLVEIWNQHNCSEQVEVESISSGIDEITKFIGSGGSKMCYDRKSGPGWLALSIDEKGSILCDPRVCVPEFSEKLDEFYVGRTFTKLTESEARSFVRSIIGMLKPGGSLTVAIQDLLYIGVTLATKFYRKQSSAVDIIFGRRNERRYAYTYAMLAEVMQSVGFVRIEKTVCPLRKLTEQRRNDLGPLDTNWDFPTTSMVVIGYRPKIDTEPAFSTLEGLPPNVLEKSLKYHGNRLKIAGRPYRKRKKK